MDEKKCQEDKLLVLKFPNNMIMFDRICSTLSCCVRARHFCNVTLPCAKLHLQTGEVHWAELLGHRYLSVAPVLVLSGYPAPLGYTGKSAGSWHLGIHRWWQHCCALISTASTADGQKPKVGHTGSP